MQITTDFDSAKIHKFRLLAVDINIIEMPQNALVLTVQVQGDMPVLWAIVDPRKPPVKRAFRVYPTGHAMYGGSNTQRYVGTFQVKGGALVFHVFEMMNHFQHEMMKGGHGEYLNPSRN